MPIFFKSSFSKTVDESSLVLYEENKLPKEEEEKDKDACTSLTIWRKSLLFSCKGFTVFGCDGNLKYRVDCYNGRRPTQVILMDESGHPLLTLSRKMKLGLADIWLIYEGEETEDLSSCNKNQTKKPIFVFKRNKSILRPGNMNVLAYVYRGMNEKRYSYVIEGSYVNRCCRILEDPTKRVVAEVKNKESVKGGSVSFGLEVFLLIVKSGFDSKFAMAFILLLDQMFA